MHALLINYYCLGLKINYEWQLKEVHYQRKCPKRKMKYKEEEKHLQTLERESPS
jgi:hypothetical protein